MAAALALPAMAATPAGGLLDLPMGPELAAERLDSKTCFGEIRSKGKLVGYELGGLLVSIGGRLRELERTSAAAIAAGKRRAYQGEGIEVTIMPNKIARRRTGANAYAVREQGVLRVVRKDATTKLPVLVVFDCSP